MDITQIPDSPPKETVPGENKDLPPAIIAAEEELSAAPSVQNAILNMLPLSVHLTQQGLSQWDRFFASMSVSDQRKLKKHLSIAAKAPAPKRQRATPRAKTETKSK